MWTSVALLTAAQLDFPIWYVGPSLTPLLSLPVLLEMWWHPVPRSMMRREDHGGMDKEYGTLNAVHIAVLDVEVCDVC